MLDLLLEHGADVIPKDDAVNQALHDPSNSQSSVSLDLKNNARDECVVLMPLDQSLDINVANSYGEC